MPWPQPPHTIPPPSQTPDSRRSSSELTRLRDKIENLKFSHLLQRDELRALKAQVASYQDEIASMNRRLQQAYEDQLWNDEAPALAVGRDVRLRFLERHRLRLKRSTFDSARQRIKAGDRAAHRGRPVADAMLYVEGLMQDQEVYLDLYGQLPYEMLKNEFVSELVEVAGFRGSLQSEGRLSEQFEMLYRRLMSLVANCGSPRALRAAFAKNKMVQECYHGLQETFDKIVSENEGFRSPRVG